MEACAAQGVDVMMEKPMATTVKQAHAIETAVKKSGIQLIVNYETSWYPATQAAYVLVHDDHQIGISCARWFSTMATAGPWKSVARPIFSRG